MIKSRNRIPKLFNVNIYMEFCGSMHVPEVEHCKQACHLVCQCCMLFTGNLHVAWNCTFLLTFIPNNALPRWKISFYTCYSNCRFSLFLIVPYHSENQFLLMLFRIAEFRWHLLWILYTSIYKVLHAFIYNGALP